MASVLRDEVDSSHSAISISHIKIPGKKNRGFLEFLEQTNIEQFAIHVQEKNPSHLLSRDEIAACWVARVNQLWTIFEYQSSSHDAEIHRPKFHEALLQPENSPFYTRAELYVDRMMNPGLSDRKLAKKRTAERKLERSMQDSLSLMLGGFNVYGETSSGLKGGGVTESCFTDRDREVLDRHERHRKQSACQVIMNHVTAAILEKDRIERVEERQELKRKQFEHIQQTQYQRRGKKRKTKTKRQRLKLAIGKRSADSMELDNLGDSINKVDGSAGRLEGQKECRKRGRPQETESDSSDLEGLICDSDTAEAGSEDVKMMFQETLQAVFGTRTFDTYSKASDISQLPEMDFHLLEGRKKSKHTG